jgi:16S rRNA (uracil1498-N3)-methyltransferase
MEASGDPAATLVLRPGPHVFVTDLDRPELDESDLHHLGRVRRLRPGEPVTASDGYGSWRDCRFTGDAELEPAGPLMRDAQPSPLITVGFALVKGDKPDLVVQKLTEVGVDVIVPFVAERSVVRWDTAKAARHLDRWRVVVRHAAMQCKRAWLPSVEAVMPFADAVASMSVLAPNRVMARADVGGEPLAASVTTLFVGPEGGWSEGERNLLPAAVRLGPHVLRAETAAIVAGALLVARHR